MDLLKNWSLVCKNQLRYSRKRTSTECPARIWTVSALASAVDSPKMLSILRHTLRSPFSDRIPLNIAKSPSTASRGIRFRSRTWYDFVCGNAATIQNISCLKISSALWQAFKVYFISNGPTKTRDENHAISVGTESCDRQPSHELSSAENRKTAHQQKNVDAF